MNKRPLQFIPYLIVAVSILLLAFFLRITDLGEVSFWLDEAYTTDSIRIATEGEGFVASVKARFNHMPLYFASILLYPGEHSDFSLRYPSVLWSMLTLAMLARILTHIYHFRRYALFAIFLLAIQSLAIIQAREARMYPMSNFMAVTATYFFLQYLHKENQCGWGLMAVFSTLAYLTHIGTFILIPAQGLILLWRFVTRQTTFGLMVRWGVTQALAIAPALLWIASTFSYHPGRLDWVQLPTPEIVVFVLGQLHYGHLDLVSVGWERAVFLVCIPLVMTLLALRHRYVLYWIGLTWLAVIALIVASFMVQPVFDERYLSVVLFAYVVLLVMGYRTIGDFVLARFRYAGVIVLLLIIGIHVTLVSFATFLRFNNGTFSEVYHKQALQYVSDHIEPDDMIIATYNPHILTWYGEMMSLDVIRTTESPIEPYLTGQSIPDHRIWFVTSVHAGWNDMAIAEGFEPIYQSRTDYVYLIMPDSS